MHLNETQLRSLRIVTILRRFFGLLIGLNFAVFWAAPILIQGQLYHLGLHRILRPVYLRLDRSPLLRSFAARHVYRRSVHVDYFATAILLLTGVAISLGAVFVWQISFGALPWWILTAYYFSWVGFGGRGMGAAYTFAHREGHAAGGMYRPRVARYFGNIFENRVGLWYGMVPHIFSTSHVFLHHRLNAGKSDPLYIWDLDRTRFSDMLLYQWRAFVYMTGFSSLREFRRQQTAVSSFQAEHAKLRKGMLTYWVIVPAFITALLIGTGSSMSSTILFLFFVYFQPLFAMSSFIAMMVLAQHGFLEHDTEGKNLKHVTSITILDGRDDSFGEDDHFFHHHRPAVTHEKLVAMQPSEKSEWARCNGSVFRNISILEVAILFLFGRIDRLIDRHHVNFSGMGREQLIALFKSRARRTEMSYEDYEFRYLPGLGEGIRDLVNRGIFENENRAYIYQAHHNVDLEMVGK